jgi:hypothetical protein
VFARQKEGRLFIFIIAQYFLFPVYFGDVGSGTVPHEVQLPTDVEHTEILAFGLNEVSASDIFEAVLQHGFNNIRLKEDAV